LIEIASTAEFLPEQAALQDSWSARIVCEHRPPTPTASGTRKPDWRSYDRIQRRRVRASDRAASRAPQAGPQERM